MIPPSEPENACVTVRVDGPSGTIILRRPDRRNALSRELTRQLCEGLQDLLQQRSVRAVILTGEGTAFCSGSDLNELHTSRGSSEEQAQWFADLSAVQELYLAILRYPKPVIAAVNGAALGTGVGLVSACDLAIACPESVFGLPESRRGLSAGITVPLLHFRLGASRTSQFLLHPEPVSAEQACQMGLVQELVSHDLLWARANELAGGITQLAPESVSLTKRVLNETVGESLITQLSVAAAATATARTTSVSEEGVAAFLQKRSPDWNRPI